MKKNSFISGIAFASVFFVSLNANALEELQTIYKIVDQNAIKKYVQQFKPEQERINKSCKLASTSSKEYFQTDMQKNKHNSDNKIIKEKELCLDNKYLATTWGQENLVAHCDVKASRKYLSECYLHIKKENEFIFYAQLVLDSRDRKAYFFGEEIDINLFIKADHYINERNSMDVHFNMKYSINEEGGLELHLYQGKSDKLLYTQTFEQFK